MEEIKETNKKEETKPRPSQAVFMALQTQGKIDRKIMLRVKHKVYQLGNFSVLC